MLNSPQPPTPHDLPIRVQKFDELPDSALMSVREISLMSGKSTATLWRDVHDGLLPEPHKIGPNSTRWRVGDVRRFLEGASDVETNHQDTGR